MMNNTESTTPEEIFPIWSIVASYADDETVKQSFLLVPELMQLGYREIAVRASLQTRRFLEDDCQWESKDFGKCPWGSLDFAERDFSREMWAMWSCRFTPIVGKDCCLENPNIDLETFFRLVGTTAQSYTDWRCDRFYDPMMGYPSPHTYWISDDKQLGLQSCGNPLESILGDLWSWIRIVGVRPRVEALSKFLIETQQLENICSNL